MGHLLAANALNCIKVPPLKSKGAILLANALKMKFDLYFNGSRSQWPNSWNVGHCGQEVSKTSNTFDIWPLLVKWGSIFKNRIITYISVNVGHSDLILGMEVKVIYRCHMSPAKLKYLYKRKTCHHLLANALKMEFDLYLHESRSQWLKSWNIGQCDLVNIQMSNTFEYWLFLIKWRSV